MTPFEIFRKTLIVYRLTPTTWVNGRAVQGFLSTFPITASVQPTSGEDLMSLPEARRNRKAYALFTSTQLFVVHGNNDNTNPDQIDIDGERYEIVKVEVWKNNPSVFGIVNHYKCIAMAIEVVT